MHAHILLQEDSHQSNSNQIKSNQTEATQVYLGGFLSSQKSENPLKVFGSKKHA